MLSKVKRVGMEELDSVLSENKKMKTSCHGGGYSQEWKFWVLSNYEVWESAVTFVNDIIELSQEHRTNIEWSSSLGKTALGICIRELFDGRVILVRRGPRKNQHYAYLNLRRKQKQGVTVPEEASSPVFSELVKGVKLPEKWHLEIDHEDQVTFYRREKLEFDGQRVTLELTVEMSKQQPPCPNYRIKSHKCQADLSALLKLPPVDCVSSPLTMTEQILYVVSYLDGAKLCLGISLEEGEKMSTLLPHITGKLFDVTDPEKKTEARSFSSACQIISKGTALYCSNCGHLKYMDNRKKLRSEKSTSVNPFCNKKFLSKEDVVQQLKHEHKLRRNAEMREQYCRKKFESKALEMDDEDQTVTSSVSSKNTYKEGCLL